MTIWVEVTAVATGVLAVTAALGLSAAIITIKSAKHDRTAATLLALYNTHQSDELRTLRRRLLHENGAINEETQTRLSLEDVHNLVQYYELVGTYWAWELVDRERLIELYTKSVPGVYCALRYYIDKRKQTNPHWAVHFEELAVELIRRKKNSEFPYDFERPSLPIDLCEGVPE